MGSGASARLTRPYRLFCRSFIQHTYLEIITVASVLCKFEKATMEDRESDTVICRGHYPRLLQAADASSFLRLKDNGPHSARNLRP